MPGALPVPVAPAAVEAGPLSPGAVKRLNVKAFEFRPGASTFTPTGASPSPQRTPSTTKKTPENRSFFAKKPKKDVKPDLNGAFEPDYDISKMGELAEDQKKAIAANGGAPQPYRTPPTWGHTEKNVNASFRDGLARQPPLMHSQGPSPMQTPGPNMGGQMPHSHQLPPQLQAPQTSTPSQRPQHMMPPHHGPYPPQFNPQMGGQPMYGPNGSVQNSPRFPQAQMAYGGGHMQPMGMPQFGGQGMPGMLPLYTSLLVTCTDHYCRLRRISVHATPSTSHASPDRSNDDGRQRSHALRPDATNASATLPQPRTSTPSTTTTAPTATAIQPANATPRPLHERRRSSPPRRRPRIFAHAASSAARHVAI